MTTLGRGLLWRPELARFVAAEHMAGRLDFVEVIAESVGRGSPAPPPGLTVVPHGVGLGLGGAERPAPARLRLLADAAEACSAPLLSEHVAFVRSGTTEAGHLLPLPRTRDALDVLVANVRVATDALPVPLALEPIAALADWPDPGMTELAFLTELLDRTDANLVLDLANVHVNAANRRRVGISGPDADPMALIGGLPPERISYVHAAGGRVVDGRHHDTHTDPLWPEVETLVEELWSRHEVPGLLLERDDHFPGDDALRAELTRLAEAAARGRSRRAPSFGSSRVLAPETRGGPRVSGARTKESQRQLVHALTAGSEPPPGFDPADVEAIAAVLVAKRRAAVARTVPDIAAIPGFAAAFTQWARTHPLLPGGSGRDAVRFLDSLPRRQRTPYACAAAALLALEDGWTPRLRLRRSDRGTAVAARCGRRRGVRILGLR